jgi:hypothetical protein
VRKQVVGEISERLQLLEELWIGPACELQSQRSAILLNLHQFMFKLGNGLRFLQLGQFDTCGEGQSTKDT